MKNKNQIVNEIQDSLKNIFDGKLKNIFLFGSYARGDNNDESDIDFLAIIDDEPEKYDDIILDLIVDLSLKYELVVSVFLENREKYNNKKNIIPLYRNIKQEGIQIYAA